MLPLSIYNLEINTNIESEETVKRIWYFSYEIMLEAFLYLVAY